MIDELNCNFVFGITKDDIDLTQNTLKTNQSVFIKLQDQCCSTEKYATGLRPLEEAINFGSQDIPAFFAIDAYDDPEFEQTRYDLGYGSAKLD